MMLLNVKLKEAGRKKYVITFLRPNYCVKLIKKHMHINCKGGIALGK